MKNVYQMLCKLSKFIELADEGTNSDSKIQIIFHCYFVIIKCLLRVGFCVYLYNCVSFHICL